MKVQKVLASSGEVSWTVLGDDLLPVEPVEAYLAHLSALERSPNTLRAYAHGLKLWMEFLDLQQVDWADAGVERVSRFVAWLRAPAANVIVLDASASRRAPSTVNRHLASVFGFYDFHARAGVVLAADLVAWRRVGRGSYKPFLHHVTGGKPIPTRPIKLVVPRRIPVTLTDEQVRTLLSACTPAAGSFPAGLAGRDRRFLRGSKVPKADILTTALVEARSSICGCATGVVHVVRFAGTRRLKQLWKTDTHPRRSVAQASCRVTRATSCYSRGTPEKARGSGRRWACATPMWSAGNG
ncbi:MAG TPA: site-specific integrase [Kineosporiaceae bacterium]|nr:site-specific integrase [Kineosporiaceae bacterium]